jgi:hypothetical protein
LALEVEIIDGHTHHRIHLQGDIQSYTGDTAMKVLYHTYGRTFFSQDFQTGTLGISCLVSSAKPLKICKWIMTTSKTP